MDFENTSNQSDFFDSSTPTTSDRSSPPDKPLDAPHATQHDTSDENSICRECRQVDWDMLPFLAEKLEQGDLREFRTIRTIEANHEQLAASSCKICRLLSVVMPPSLDQTEWDVDARRLLNPRKYFPPDGYDWGTKSPITALQVSPGGINTSKEASGSRCLVAIRDEVFSSMTIPPRSIDYHWPKLLTRWCEKCHWERCRSGWLDPVSVPGLKVIEVSSRIVIEAPAECRYVALSYVWGKQPDVSPTLHLQRPPPLIEDAISVTIAMGYQYLWIDRYCIPQADDQERHRMINQMDQVYSNASLTIIDASGGDAQSGLPGVSSLSRRPQKSVHIRNTALLEMPYAEDELSSSKWATRGWTYQEGYFSTRRLIFTPSQVLFLCNTIYNAESLHRLTQCDSPGRWAITSRLQHMIPDFRGIGAMNRTQYLLVHLEEYSKRELTYQSDSLDALLGVLNSYAPTPSRRQPAFLHIVWGLLVRRSKRNSPLLVYLNWYHEAPARRRPQLPSWTWAGWGGPVVMPDDDEGIPLPNLGSDPLPFSHLDMEVFCEPEGQNPANIRNLAPVLSDVMYTDRLQRHRQLTYLKRLHITCRVVPVRFQKNPLKEAQSGQTIIDVENNSGCLLIKRLGSTKKNVAVVKLCKGIYVATAPYLDQDSDQDLEKQSDVIGLLFTRKDKDSVPFIAIGCLLARPLDGGLYERVGAIPYVMVRPESRFLHLPLEHPRAQLIFLDEAGSVIDEIGFLQRQNELSFEGAGERKTIILV